VASSSRRLQAGNADIWDSGKIESMESVGIVYHGPALESRRRYNRRVRVWDAEGKVSGSGAAWWEMGLLHAADWKANWIRPPGPDDAEDRRAIRWIWAAGQDGQAAVPGTTATFRVTVDLSEPPREAVLFLAAQGNFVAQVNGHEIDSKKNWGTFLRRDIAEHLGRGTNSIEVKVTAPESPRYGPNQGAQTTKAALAALVKITRSNGSTLSLPTGEKWESSLGNTSRWQPAQVVAAVTGQGPADPGPMPQPAWYLRHTLSISKNVRSARLYATALGSYRIFLNGSRVGDDVLTPDFTDYRKRVL
jgi:alpha-L-rhamnosidase